MLEVLSRFSHRFSSQLSTSIYDFLLDAQTHQFNYSVCLQTWLSRALRASRPHQPLFLPLPRLTSSHLIQSPQPPCPSPPVRPPPPEAPSSQLPLSADSLWPPHRLQTLTDRARGNGPGVRGGRRSQSREERAEQGCQTAGTGAPVTRQGQVYGVGVSPAGTALESPDEVGTHSYKVEVHSHRRSGRRTLRASRIQMHSQFVYIQVHSVEVQSNRVSWSTPSLGILIRGEGTVR